MSEPSEVEIAPVKDTTPEQHKMGVFGALAKRFIEQMYFRNILAVAIVMTFCYKEIADEGVSDHFGMIAALVVGMYFPSGEKQKL
jgi:hypothetical protein